MRVGLFGDKVAEKSENNSKQKVENEELIPAIENWAVNSQRVKIFTAQEQELHNPEQTQRKIHVSEKIWIRLLPRKTGGWSLALALGLF